MYQTLTSVTWKYLQNVKKNKKQHQFFFQTKLPSPEDQKVFDIPERAEKWILKYYATQVLK